MGHSENEVGQKFRNIGGVYLHVVDLGEGVRSGTLSHCFFSFYRVALSLLGVTETAMTVLILSFERINAEMTSIYHGDHEGTRMNSVVSG